MIQNAECRIQNIKDTFGISQTPSDRHRSRMDSWYGILHVGCGIHDLGFGNWHSGCNISHMAFCIWRTDVGFRIRKSYVDLCERGSRIRIGLQRWISNFTCKDQFCSRGGDKSTSSLEGRNRAKNIVLGTKSEFSRTKFGRKFRTRDEVEIRKDEIRIRKDEIKSYQVRNVT